MASPAFNSSGRKGRRGGKRPKLTTIGQLDAAALKVVAYYQKSRNLSKLCYDAFATFSDSQALHSLKELKSDQLVFDTVIRILEVEFRHHRLKNRIKDIKELRIVASMCIIMLCLGYDHADTCLMRQLSRYSADDIKSLCNVTVDGDPEYPDHLIKMFCTRAGKKLDELRKLLENRELHSNIHRAFNKCLESNLRRRRTTIKRAMAQQERMAASAARSVSNSGAGTNTVSAVLSNNQNSVVSTEVSNSGSEVSKRAKSSEMDNVVALNLTPPESAQQNQIHSNVDRNDQPEVTNITVSHTVENAATKPANAKLLSPSVSPMKSPRTAIRKFNELLYSSPVLNTPVIETKQSPSKPPLKHKSTPVTRDSVDHTKQPDPNRFDLTQEINSLHHGYNPTSVLKTTVNELYDNIKHTVRSINDIDTFNEYYVDRFGGRMVTEFIEWITKHLLQTGYLVYVKLLSLDDPKDTILHRAIMDTLYQQMAQLKISIGQFNNLISENWPTFTFLEPMPANLDLALRIIENRRSSRSLNASMLSQVLPPVMSSSTTVTPTHPSTPHIPANVLTSHLTQSNLVAGGLSSVNTPLSFTQPQLQQELQQQLQKHLQFGIPQKHLASNAHIPNAYGGLLAKAIAPTPVKHTSPLNGNFGMPDTIQATQSRVNNPISNTHVATDPSQAQLPGIVHMGTTISVPSGKDETTQPNPLGPINLGNGKSVPKKDNVSKSSGTDASANKLHAAGGGGDGGDDSDGSDVSDHDDDDSKDANRHDGNGNDDDRDDQGSHRGRTPHRNGDSTDDSDNSDVYHHHHRRSRSAESHSSHYRKYDPTRDHMKAMGVERLKNAKAQFDNTFAGMSNQRTDPSVVGYKGLTFIFAYLTWWRLWGETAYANKEHLAVEFILTHVTGQAKSCLTNDMISDTSMTMNSLSALTEWIREVYVREYAYTQYREKILSWQPHTFQLDYRLSRAFDDLERKIHIFNGLLRALHPDFAQGLYIQPHHIYNLVWEILQQFGVDEELNSRLTPPLSEPRTYDVLKQALVALEAKRKFMNTQRRIRAMRSHQRGTQIKSKYVPPSDPTSTSAGAQVSAIRRSGFRNERPRRNYGNNRRPRAQRTDRRNNNNSNYRGRNYNPNYNRNRNNNDNRTNNNRTFNYSAYRGNSNRNNRNSARNNQNRNRNGNNNRNGGGNRRYRNNNRYGNNNRRNNGSNGNRNRYNNRNDRDNRSNQRYNQNRGPYRCNECGDTHNGPCRASNNKRRKYQRRTRGVNSVNHNRSQLQNNSNNSDRNTPSRSQRNNRNRNDQSRTNNNNSRNSNNRNSRTNRVNIVGFASHPSDANPIMAHIRQRVSDIDPTRNVTHDETTPSPSS